MDSHVAHPAGITATLGLLNERYRPSNKQGIAASGGDKRAALMSQNNKAAERLPELAPDNQFICNVAKAWKPEPNEILGAPVATKFMAADALERAGVVGLYRKGPQS
jgi:hypothetical protein